PQLGRPRAAAREGADPEKTGRIARPELRWNLRKLSYCSNQNSSMDGKLFPRIQPPTRYGLGSELRQTIRTLSIRSSWHVAVLVRLGIGRDSVAELELGCCEVERCRTRCCSRSAVRRTACWRRMPPPPEGTAESNRALPEGRPMVVEREALRDWHRLF